MKIRCGFVSNSSCSSFVVNRWKYAKRFEKVTVIISKRLEKKLIDFGFWLGKEDNPTEVRWADVDGDKHIDKNKQLANLKRKELHFNYSVIVNQDDVVEFLLKNKLSFTASVHYDQEIYVYDAKTDKLVIGQNFGNEYFMYGEEDGDVFNRKPLVVTTGKQYAKERGLKIEDKKKKGRKNED